MTVKIHQPAPEQAAAPAPAPETFVYTTERGFQLEVGKPAGPLKMRLRDILTLDEIKNDLELQRMCSAMLCIKSCNGEKPRIMNRVQFLAFIDNKFGSDNDLNNFMNEHQKFTDPELYSIIEEGLNEAVEEGITDSDAINEFIRTKVLAKATAEKDKVRL